MIYNCPRTKKVICTYNKDNDTYIFSPEDKSSITCSVPGNLSKEIFAKRLGDLVTLFRDIGQAQAKKEIRETLGLK